MYSLNQANKALLLIRPIVQDIFKNIEKRNASKVLYHIAELKKLNLNIKNLHLGIIEFPMKEGFYSWKTTESEVTYYRANDESPLKRKYIYNTAKK